MAADNAKGSVTCHLMNIGEAPMGSLEIGRATERLKLRCRCLPCWALSIIVAAILPSGPGQTPLLPLVEAETAKDDRPDEKIGEQ